MKWISTKKVLCPFFTLAALIGLIMVQSCTNADVSDGAVLKFNLEKNKQYDYEIIWDTDQQVMGNTSKINLLADYSFEVTDEKDKIKTLRGVYKSFRMYMKIMEMEMDIDTGKPVDPASTSEEDIMKRMFAGIIGKSFTMKVDEEGTVLSVEGFDDIIKSMIDSSAVNEDMKLQMRISLKDQFNEQELKNQFAQAFMIFPNKVVKPGDSWQKKYLVIGKMPANYLTTYKIKKVEGDKVTIDAKTNISSAGTEMEVTGKQNGTLLVDSKSGLVLTADFDQEMESKMKDFQIKINGKGKIRGKER